VTPLDQDVLSALGNLGCAPAAAEAAVRKAKLEGATGFEPLSAARSNWCAKLKGHAGARNCLGGGGRRRSYSSKPACGRASWPSSPGQTKLKENLSIAIEAARRRGDAMDHVLLLRSAGPRQNTLASIISAELEVGFEQTSGRSCRRSST